MTRSLLIFFKQIIKTLGPSLLSLINKCLSAGTIPDQLKHTIVRPQLKKVNLDPYCLTLDRFQICLLLQKN